MSDFQVLSDYLGRQEAGYHLAAVTGVSARKVEDLTFLLGVPAMNALVDSIAKTGFTLEDVAAIITREER